MNTTELIQELVGICIDRGVNFEYTNGREFFTVDSWIDVFFNGSIREDGADEKLKAAIEKVKAL